MCLSVSSCPTKIQSFKLLLLLTLKVSTFILSGLFYWLSHIIYLLPVLTDIYFSLIIIFSCLFTSCIYNIVITKIKHTITSYFNCKRLGKLQWGCKGLLCPTKMQQEEQLIAGADFGVKNVCLLKGLHRDHWTVDISIQCRPKVTKQSQYLFLRLCTLGQWTWNKTVAVGLTCRMLAQIPTCLHLY